MTTTDGLDPNHIYYYSCKVYFPYDNVNGSFDFYWPITEPPCFSGLTASKGKTWTRISAVFDRKAHSNSSGSKDCRFDYNNNYSTMGINFTSVMLIDLTSAFGTGNESTKEFCDANISFFDGTKTFDIQGYFSLRPLFQAIADAIRSRKGGNTKIKAYNFPEEIRKL